MNSTNANSESLLLGEYPSIAPFGRAEINFNDILLMGQAVSRYLNLKTEVDCPSVERRTEQLLCHLTVNTVCSN